VRLRWQRHSWILALVCASACKEAQDVAETIVWVDAESAAQAAIARIEVQAEGPTGDLEPAVKAEHPEWPIKLVLAPKNADPSRSFTLQIAVFDAQARRLATIRFASGFVAKQSRYARLMIHDACVQAAASCEDCNLWTLELSASALSRDAQQPRKLDAVCGPPDMKPPPSSSDAGSAGSLNAGQGAAGSGPTAAGAGAAAAGSGGQGGGCAPGFLQMGGACIDIDDCQNGNLCGAHGHCENTPGNYICQCDPGYQSQAGACVSLDGCQMNNGGCETNCQISPAGAVCSCAKDEWLKADRKSCAAFGPAARASRTGSVSPTHPSFAFDAEGNGLAVWTQSDGMTTTLWTRRYLAGSGWAASPLRLAVDDSGVPSAPHVSLAANGHGVIVWQQTGSSDGDIWAVRYTNPTFGEPGRIDQTSTGSAFDPFVQLDSAGNGFATWTQSNGSVAQIWINRLLNDKGWQGPVAVQAKSEDSVFGARLALDQNGNASLVWTQTTYNDGTQSMPMPMGMPPGWMPGWTQWMGGGTEFAPWSARFEPKMGRWQAPTKLDDTGPAGLPDIQLYGPGPEPTRVAVWPRMANGAISMRASSSSAKGWSDSINIATSTSQVTGLAPRLALAPSGNGAAVWTELHGSTYTVWANRHEGAGGQWIGATELSSLDSATSSPVPQIAVDPSGDGFAIWAETRGTTRVIKAARLQAEVGFVGNTLVSTDMTAADPQNSQVQIAVDAQGSAMAIWDELEAGRYFVAASVFE
jgi:hypothetical protein